MARKVFFSFHYEDVTRANVVRNSNIIAKQYIGASRFYDRSLWEAAKTTGPKAVKAVIDPQLEGTSVTCVLIGQQGGNDHGCGTKSLRALRAAMGSSVYVSTMLVLPRGECRWVRLRKIPLPTS